MYENSGIYLIINKINGKVYVGSAINFIKRWRIHLSRLKRRKHNPYLQNAYEKHGIDAFEFKIFEKEIPFENLLYWEQAVLDFYKSYLPENGYNICQFAGNSLGRKHSTESCLKMSQSRKGSKHYFYGQKMSNEQRLKISQTSKLNKNKMPQHGQFNNQAKLTELQVVEIKSLLKENNLKQREIALLYNVHEQTISNIKRGINWKHV